MGPFDRYPGEGRVLLGKLSGANARHEYGLRLQRKTGISTCAYCGLDLTTSYETWLLLQVDHVVPRSVAMLAGIPKAFYEDMVNCVIACSGCNGFDNHFHYVVPQRDVDWNLDDFLLLRDEVFTRRFARIAALQDSERAFFATQPWVSSI